jgi:hypothetical protein
MCHSINCKTLSINEVQRHLYFACTEVRAKKIQKKTQIQSNPNNHNHLVHESSKRIGQSEEPTQVIKAYLPTRRANTFYQSVSANQQSRHNSLKRIGQSKEPRPVARKVHYQVLILDLNLHQHHSPLLVRLILYGLEFSAAGMASILSSDYTVL